MELHHPIMSKLWDLGGRTKRRRGDVYPKGSPAHDHYQLNKSQKLCFQEPIKERVENWFSKRQMLGPYIICTRLHYLNRKIKNVLVFAIWFYILFYFILFSVLLIHFISVQIKYDVWYLVVFIDYLRVILMTIPFQIIPHWIVKYKFYFFLFYCWKTLSGWFTGPLGDSSLLLPRSKKKLAFEVSNFPSWKSPNEIVPYDTCIIFEENLGATLFAKIYI